jgi:hypothetical protein
VQLIPWYSLIVCFLSRFSISRHFRSVLLPCWNVPWFGPHWQFLSLHSDTNLVANNKTKKRISHKSLTSWSSLSNHNIHKYLRKFRAGRVTQSVEGWSPEFKPSTAKKRKNLKRSLIESQTYNDVKNNI